MLTNEQIEKAYRDVWSTVPHAGRLSAFARAIEAEVRKEDEALILQLTLALEMPCQWRSPRQNEIVGKAIGDARARLLDSDLSKLTERGKDAWPGVDAQKLREGGGL